MAPYTFDNLWTKTHILSDSDLKNMDDNWSDKTLSARYYQNLDYLKAAEPNREGLKVKPRRGKQPEPIPGLDDTNQGLKSNAWVVSGKHTATGYPILMSDPHLESGLPNLIIINEVIWQDKFMIGGSLPGIPLVILGRGKNLSFAHTTPNCDSSDVW